ncbi:ras di-ras and rheb family members of small gtpase superfamily [Anaeramoeba flamelloides]|uniref:Ras di-ras and rheb family members of small gtpase superfamily n=1 Tax=Anaeramoeba flamelloides TaxID=1746091 RepID=A0AAV8A795_9EUKA|nr:ras di-ras and rheb family members of small gtpase superfamily [Anaeramoeba flamelloides]
MEEDYKIMILGDTKVGKTSFQRCLQNNLLCDINKEWQKTYNWLLELEESEHFLEILDTIIQEPIGKLFQCFSENFQCYILMYSVTCKNSFQKVQQFHRKFQMDRRENFKYVLLANKIDDQENTKERKISKQEGEQLARQFGCPYFEISLKTKENVISAFVDILHYFAILKEKINHEDLVEDFQNLFERQEFCDHVFQLKDNEQISVHRLILESRLKISLEKIQEVLLTITSKQAKNFLKWVYCGYIKNSYFSDLKSICQKLDLNYIDFSGVNKLIHDLKDLNENEKTKDFTLKIGETHLRTHKLILTARSNLFRGFFLSCKKSINQVKDYSKKSPIIIENLIHFFYTNQIPIPTSKKSYLELLELIDYYQLNIKSSLNKKLCKAKKRKECSIM